jgi:hypothetical protein
MEVYVLPLGKNRYELYCETPDDDHADEGSQQASGGLIRRVKDWIRKTLDALERESQKRDPARDTEMDGAGWWARLQARLRGWIAEKVAEQRLLWRLHGRSTAALVFPRDLSKDEADAVMRRSFQRDLDQHWFWLAIDGVAFVLSGLLALIPGPNLVAYYFAFRLAGHYLSIRGARQGLDRIQWTFEPSQDLEDLRQAIALGRRDRQARVAEIASRLRLEHLPRFVERTCARTA